MFTNLQQKLVFDSHDSWVLPEVLDKYVYINIAEFEFFLICTTSLSPFQNIEHQKSVCPVHLLTAARGSQ